MATSIQDYPYQDNISTPRQLGMRETGTIPQLGRNVRGLTEYVRLLLAGTGRASATRNPLGNKYFLKTGAQCRATDTCERDETGNLVCKDTARYIYLNNVPGGRIPFISSGFGVNFTQFRGLVPGAIENLNALNPSAVFRAFRDGATPPCQRITMETIDNNNNSRPETHYVTLSDIRAMDPCWFGDNYNRTNPVTKRKCRETFETLNPAPVMSDDPLDQLYFVGLAGVGIYVFYRIMEKAS